MGRKDLPSKKDVSAMNDDDDDEVSFNKCSLQLIQKQDAGGSSTPPGIRALINSEEAPPNLVHAALNEHLEQATRMFPKTDSVTNNISLNPPSRSDEFENYKKTKGVEIYKILTDNKGTSYI